MSSVISNRGEVSGLFDRRRREHAELRERILHRCELLEPVDRALLESVYERDMPIVRLAEIRGEPPWRLRRRVRMLVRRLLSPLATFIIANEGNWEPERWQVARRHLLAGCEMRRTAKELGLTLHRVRQHVYAVRTLMREREREQQASGEKVRRRNGE
ncbi:MAG TPA: hypothetical protein ENJ06_04755 [Phycisphaeraceae bacterium]|nr:hypothetical protein [Phycisphaeraceae bacterium]